MLRTRKEIASARNFAKAALLAEHSAMPRGRKRVAFVISHIGPGGAQRVVTNAVKILAERGLDPHLIVFTERADAYPIDPRVTTHVWLRRRNNDDRLGLDGGNEDDVLVAPVPAQVPRRARSLRQMVPSSLAFSFELVRISAWLRRTIRDIEPDAVLSFLTQTNIITVLATRGLGTHTVISERNDPRLQRHRPRVEYLRRVVYRWADVVTANSKGALATLEAFVPKEKLAYLPNPLGVMSEGDAVALPARTVITVGRLVEQKGLDVLLAAWSKASHALPGWRLAIVGSGPLEDELKARARSLGIEDSVDWLGHVADPFPLLRGSDFFVLTSRFEGTPNALLEAMACGLPAVVSDASPGPSELVGSKEDAGLIVPVEDEAATAQAIIRLGRDENLRSRLGQAARERVRTHDAAHALEVWLQLLRCE
jgi:GalNAc-alpha-(1->4)-GalNAc-alpha-(1->3)-diNAcBac-PP-undecaprenol alpha-1,4-N-acetyl-D-galactosaminyltransferase